MREVLIGQTDYTVLVKIVGTDGAPETGLTEASIDIAYSRVETDNDVTTSDVTPAALSALTDAHTDWGFEEVSSTDHPGLYRLDIADAVFASGAWEAVVTITDASGTDFYPVDIGFRLVSFNAQDGVRLGLTALPNAAADAAGGLVISDAGGFDIDNRAPAAAAVTNINTVYNTDFATNYDATNDRWRVDVKTWNNLATVALPLVPTTAGRTLDVSAGGEAGIDWANVGSPTTTLNLSGTTIKTATDVETDTQDLQNRTDSIERTGTAQDGTSSTITLDSGANSSNNYYVGMTVVLTGGTGSGQCRQIRTYTGASKQAGVLMDWITAPDSTTTFKIIGRHVIAAGVEFWTGGVINGVYTDPTFGACPNVNILAISGDATSADNLEAAADGTGYNLGGGSIVAASVTGNVGGNVTGSVGSLAAQAKADVNAEVDTALSDYDPPTNAELEARTLVAADYFDPATDTVANVTTVGSVTTKTGYKLASDGLDLVVPADPAAIPTLGTSSIVVWNGYFAAQSVNKWISDDSEARLRNSADTDDLATYAHSDDGTDFTSGEPT